MTTSDLNTFSGMVEGGNSKPVHITNSTSAPIPVSISGSASFIVDTEFPTAAPLQDATPNPTTTLVGAMNEVWNGATWDRWPGNTNGGFVQGPVAHDSPIGGNPVSVGGVANNSTPTAVTAGDVVRTWHSLSGSPVIIPLHSVAVTDAETNVRRLLDQNNADFDLASGLLLYDGSANFNRYRNNHEVTILASAARAVDTNSADQTNFNAVGVIVDFDLTVKNSTSLTVTIKNKDTLSGVYTTVLASAAIAATGHTALLVAPGVTVTANVSAAARIARIWRVEITRVAGASDTYSVSAQFLN